MGTFRSVLAPLLNLEEPGASWLPQAVLLLIAITTSAVAVSVSPLFLKVIVDRAIAGVPTPDLLLYGFLYIAALACGRFSADGQWIAFWGLERRLLARLRSFVIRFIVAAPLSYHHDNPVGSVLQRINHATRGVTAVLQSLFVSALPIGLQLVSVVVLVSGSISVEFGLLFTAAAAAYAAVFYRANRNAIQLNRVHAEASSSFHAIAGEFISGAETMKLTGATGYASSRLCAASGHLDSSLASFQRARGQASLASSVVFSVTLGGVLLWAAVRLGGAALTPGQFILLATCATQILRPLEAIGMLHRDWSSALVMLDQGKDFVVASQLRADAGNRAPEQGVALSVAGVTYTYEGGGVALDNVSFDVRIGERVAVVGESGSGKTTLVRVVAGALAPDTGEVRKASITTVEPGTAAPHRTFVTVLPQDTALFDDSLRANLVLDATPAPNQAEIDRAVALCQLEQVLARLPEGLEGRVGRQGAKLSAGERQRIGLARALLQSPAVLVLDEPTSALDARTEASILDALASFDKRQAILSVAHRLRTVAGYDRILVMHGGRVVESGTHGELLQLGGRYAHLWSAQERADS